MNPIESISISIESIEPFLNHWIYLNLFESALNQLNHFKMIESIWNNIQINWLQVPRTTMKKDFSRQISKSWISGNFKIKIRILHSKKHQKNFLWFFPDFSVKYFWESIWFHKSYWIPDYIQRKIFKKSRFFFPVKSQSFKWNQNQFQTWNFRQISKTGFFPVKFRKLEFFPVNFKRYFFFG